MTPRLAITTALLVLLAAAPPALAQSTSEEDPPATCGNRLLAGITCSGSYCDNIRPSCGSFARDLYDIRWTGYVSEEGGGTAACHVPNPFERGDWPSGEPAFITGFACKGSYCDNLALECVALRDAFPESLGGGACRWTGWVSEEQGTLSFPPNTGAIRMQCRGSYCDDKRFFVCPIIPR